MTYYEIKDVIYLALTALNSPVDLPSTSCCNDKWTSPHKTKINTTTNTADPTSLNKNELTSDFFCTSP